MYFVFLGGHWCSAHSASYAIFSTHSPLCNLTTKSDALILCYFPKVSLLKFISIALPPTSQPSSLLFYNFLCWIIHFSMRKCLWRPSRENERYKNREITTLNCSHSFQCVKCSAFYMHADNQRQRDSKRESKREREGARESKREQDMAREWKRVRKRKKEREQEEERKKETIYSYVYINDAMVKCTKSLRKTIQQNSVQLPCPVICCRRQCLSIVCIWALKSCLSLYYMSVSARFPSFACSDFPDNTGPFVSRQLVPFVYDIVSTRVVPSRLCFECWLCVYDCV